MPNVDEEENKIINMIKYLTFSPNYNANDIILLDDHAVQDRMKIFVPNDICFDSGSDVSDADIHENHLSNECATNSRSCSLRVATDINGFNKDTRQKLQNENVVSVR